MARGKKCPNCKNSMSAETQKDYPAGTEVVYFCRSCNFREKVFEDNPH